MVSLKVCALLLVAFAVLAEAKVSKKLAKEEFISKRVVGCLPVEFKCGTGECIPQEWWCDAEADCNDASDETIPPCPPDCTGHNQFKCANGNCIPAQYECDKDDDCGDFSDEAHC